MLIVSFLSSMMIFEFGNVLARSNSYNRNHSFPIFDSIFYHKKPNLVDDYGFAKIQLIYAKHLWPQGTVFDSSAQTPKEPDEQTVRQLARSLSSDVIVCLDIEHWPIYDCDETTALNNIRKLSKIVDWMHQENPRLKIGYYGIFPARRYRVVYFYKKALASRGTPEWDSWKDQFEELKKNYQDWQDDNERAKKLARHVDIIFPSFYTGSDDTEIWQIFAITALNEAKQYYKPVYPFLWPQYHTSNKVLGLSFLSGKFWKLELETCHENADGVVIWSSNKPNWNPDASWWLETEKFMSDLTAKENKSSAPQTGRHGGLKNNSSRSIRR